MFKTNLKQRVIIHTGIFLIILGLLFFLSAWSIKYLEGWIYWCVFSACVIWLDVYFIKKDPGLIQRRLIVSSSGEKEKSQKIIQSFSGLFSLALFIFPGFDTDFIGHVLRYIW